MENHPIPQDVTGFQFKLIGNMTVKQFAYLATGIIMAWVLLQLPISIFIKFPLGLFSAIFGIGLTFFPISGRPVDAMIGSYIKALLRPTQFFYEKSGVQLYYPSSRASIPPAKQYINSNALPFRQKDKLKDYLESQASRKNKIDEKEDNFLTSVASLATHPPLAAPSMSTFKPAALSPAIDIPLTKPVSMPQPITDMPASKPTLQPIVSAQAQTVPVPKVEMKPGMPFIKSFNKGIGMPSAPDSPNIITGITKDARGNALANILVEVKDKEGSPVRAFKTNEFGRFASATPLMNGAYTIEFEDPKSQNKFEKGIINATGQIIQPLVAISLDAREELRKSLFSQNN